VKQNEILSLKIRCTSKNGDDTNGHQASTLQNIKGNERTHSSYPQLRLTCAIDHHKPFSLY
jgi:hypothetical protein